MDKMREKDGWFSHFMWREDLKIAGRIRRGRIHIITLYNCL